MALKTPEKAVIPFTDEDMADAHKPKGFPIGEFSVKKHGLSAEGVTLGEALKQTAMMKSIGALESLQSDMQTVKATLALLADAMKEVAKTNVAITAEMADMKHALMVVASGGPKPVANSTTGATTGMDFELSPEERTLIEKGEVIQAIKTYRARVNVLTGTLPTLKKAKDVADTYWNFYKSLPLLLPIKGMADYELNSEEKGFIHHGHIIDAIKAYRARIEALTGTLPPLVEAKDKAVAYRKHYYATTADIDVHYSVMYPLALNHDEQRIACGNDDSTTDNAAKAYRNRVSGLYGVQLHLNECYERVTRWVDGVNADGAPVDAPLTSDEKHTLNTQAPATLDIVKQYRARTGCLLSHAKAVVTKYVDGLELPPAPLSGEEWNYVLDGNIVRAVLNYRHRQSCTLQQAEHAVSSRAGFAP